MNVVIAIDSFKGSMTSLEAGCSAAEGVRRVYPDAIVKVLPVADGGEGTVDALVAGMNGTKQTVTVCDPLGRPVEAAYGLLPDGTAVIEMAAAAGITLLKPEERDPINATTYGVGQLIADAVGRGCRSFIIGIGGSATNDGGMGMLRALGYEFFDDQGAEATLETVVKVSDAHALPALKDCSFRIACDVTNPLCGENGCSAVYGPQKGATPQTVAMMDTWLARYAKAVRDFAPQADPDMPGAGAAGGIGFAFAAFLKGRLMRGIDMVLESVGLEEAVKTADLVITGEGRLDGQTAMGKAPVGVARLAKQYGRKVIAFAGAVTPQARECNARGIDAFFPILRTVCTLDEAMDKENAKQNMADTVEQVLRLI